METYARGQTALLIMDPYNDFMSVGGKLYDHLKEIADSVGFLENMRRLIPEVGAQRFIWATNK
jgi:hypothetical protein